MSSFLQSLQISRRGQNIHQDEFIGNFENGRNEYCSCFFHLYIQVFNIENTLQGGSLITMLIINSADLFAPLCFHNINYLKDYVEETTAAVILSILKVFFELILKPLPAL